MHISTTLRRRFALRLTSDGSDVSDLLFGDSNPDSHVLVEAPDSKLRADFAAWSAAWMPTLHTGILADKLADYDEDGEGWEYHRPDGMDEVRACGFTVSEVIHPHDFDEIVYVVAPTRDPSGPYDPSNEHSEDTIDQLPREDGTLEDGSPYWEDEDEAEEAAAILAASGCGPDANLEGYGFCQTVAHMPDERITDAELWAAGLTVATYIGPRGTVRFAGVDGSEGSWAHTVPLWLAIHADRSENGWTVETSKGPAIVVDLTSGARA